MKTAKCDRCGKIMDSPESRILSFNIPMRLILKYVQYDFNTSVLPRWKYNDMDLCEDCFHELMEWLEQPRAGE